MGIALVLAAAPWVIIRIGEGYRGIQEALIFVEHREGTLLRLVYRSRWLHARQTLIIYLPPSYYQSERQRYPVLYLLHGCPGQPRDWLVKADLHHTIERLMLTRAVREMILVMTDGSGPGGRFDCTLYMDNLSGSYPAETAFVRELIPMIDRRFRTLARPEDRALLGVSSGGFAALDLGVRHPELFRVLAAHSGYFRAADDPRAVRRILNSDARAWEAHSPADQIRALPLALRPHVYLNVGRSDPALGGNIAFSRELDQLRTDHSLRITPGRHGWTYWRRNLPYSLQWMSGRLGGVQVFRSSGLQADGKHRPPMPEHLNTRTSTRFAGTRRRERSD